MKLLYFQFFKRFIVIVNPKPLLSIYSILSIDKNKKSFPQLFFLVDHKYRPIIWYGVCNDDIDESWT